MRSGLGVIIIIIIITLSPVVTGLREAQMVPSPVAFVQSTATSAEMPQSLQVHKSVGCFGHEKRCWVVWSVCRQQRRYNLHQNLSGCSAEFQL